MNRASVFVKGEGPLRLRAFALWNFQFVAQVDGSDSEKLIIGFDAAFDVGFKMIC